MATEAQKKVRQMKLANSVVFGLAKGLYDLFGDSALSLMGGVGRDILQDMEKEMGLEVQGENPDAVLNEIGRILVDEYGMLSSWEVKSLGGTRAQIFCNDCMFNPASCRLKAANVPAHTCVPNAIITTVLRDRLGSKSKLASIEVTEGQCVITGDLSEA